jgi:hypothetical protein
LTVADSFSVFFQCATAVNCSSSSLSSLTYFITDTTEFTVPACVVTPGFCPNTSIGTLTSIGTISAPVSFYLLTKNSDNTYKLKISSNDVSLDGKTYKF